MFYVSLISDTDGTAAFHKVATHHSALTVVARAAISLFERKLIGWSQVRDIIDALDLHTVQKPDLVYEGLGIRIYISTEDFYR